MNILAKQVDGKFYAMVMTSGRLLYVSPDFYTKAMALADARCWAAFNGEKMSELNVMLCPGRIDTHKRPAHYGTPAYFRRVEWFDVVDRETNALLRWQVSRSQGSEIVVNDPTKGIRTDFETLEAAALWISAQR